MDKEMKHEDLIEYMENEDNFSRIDPFAEFVFGATNEEVYILLQGLQAVCDYILLQGLQAVCDMDDTWFLPLLPRAKEMLMFLQEEHTDRDLEVWLNDVLNRQAQ
jgi:hypothetical protein